MRFLSFLWTLYHECTKSFQFESPIIFQALNILSKMGTSPKYKIAHRTKISGIGFGKRLDRNGTSKWEHGKSIKAEKIAFKNIFPSRNKS